MVEFESRLQERRSVLRRASCVAREADSQEDPVCAQWAPSHERRGTSDTLAAPAGVCVRGGGGTPSNHGRDARETQGQDALATAGLYVHVPVCRSKCRYCGFYSVPAAGVDAERLVRGLLRELERYNGAAFRTAYVGGGSPTALPVGQLIRLVRQIRQRCPHVEEFTVECNPGQVSAQLLAELWEAGVNRLSFGAQSFRAAELELLGRGHSVEDIGRSVEAARQAGFENIGLDLIFAIPGSTLDDWQYSMEAALALNIRHLSAYSLSFEPGTVFEAWRAAGRLQAGDEELDRAMYDWAVERLPRAGFEQYEISNFARPGFECRHNLGYWANRPFIGIGPGAASSTGVPPVEAGPRGPGDQDSKRGILCWGPRTDSWARCPCYEWGYRTMNDPDIERYLAAVESGADIPGEVQPVDEDDTVCETAVLNLRMRNGIDLADFRHRTGRDALRTFAEPIRRYRDLGLLEVTDRAVRLTARALPIADTILCDFAALD
jgi:oxygen-independent coproporphyrinogen-3 oxidase